MSEYWQLLAVLDLSPSSMKQSYDKVIKDKVFRADILHRKKKNSLSSWKRTDGEPVHMWLKSVLNSFKSVNQ